MYDESEDGEESMRQTSASKRRKVLGITNDSHFLVLFYSFYLFSLKLKQK
jgi:hypothetical protein